ncbi:hypothetical protein JQ604_16560 [Bradyrhizobium jicamae]|uniref:hypothetical protein n=1 Tax=Bradyrhizobium jicamae TaxID=280332 RepID=UPI001BA512D6|nr:hypothetical protein [Bradyrhizobium jicamae]MBR0753799.1 hypothetical protein [Bradyrhizobium jicamae]
MRITIYEPAPIDPDSQSWIFYATTQAEKWMPLLLWLVPFVVGFLAGVAFTWLIKRRGWRTQIIPAWVIPLMFGTLAYAVAPIIVYFATFGFWPRAILAGLTASLIYTWPIWLVMGPVLYFYLAYLNKRQKWLRDSTVVYLSALSLTSECAFVFWLSH